LNLESPMKIKIEMALQDDGSHSGVWIISCDSR